MVIVAKEGFQVIFAGKMAGIIFHAPPYSKSGVRRIYTTRCCSGTSDKKTPPFLKFAVSGMTELLRVLSPGSSSNLNRPNQLNYRLRDESSVSNVDDVMMILKSDYGNAYFVTGIFTSAIYADDCIFEDPTISFQGTKLYERNLKLLVPFFEDPSIALQKIEKDVTSERYRILAKWKLRTYLKLPWRPLISINGNTVYEMGSNLKIVRHVESWDVSAMEAVAQIFTQTPDGHTD